MKLNVVKWSHIQEIDYEQIPFKCRHCHGYGHFARNCKKKLDEELEKENTNKWTQVHKASTTKQVEGKGGNAGNGAIPIEKKSLKSQTEGNVIASSNSFVVLSPTDDQNTPIL